MRNAFGMARGPSLLRVMELSALLVQSQKQNEEKEKTVETLNDTVEILVCFTFTGETAQCLLSSRSTKRCGFLKRRSGKDANCMGTSGALPKYSLCVCLAHVESVQVQAVAGELQTIRVSSSGGLHQCYSACDFKSLGIKVPWNRRLHSSLQKLAVGLSLLSFSREEIE